MNGDDPPKGPKQVRYNRADYDPLEGVGVHVSSTGRKTTLLSPEAFEKIIHTLRRSNHPDCHAMFHRLMLGRMEASERFKGRQGTTELSLLAEEAA